MEITKITRGTFLYINHIMAKSRLKFVSKMKLFGLRSSKWQNSTNAQEQVEHLKHIYEDEELEEQATCRKIRQVQMEGNREVSREFPFYNLDMIISLGYRIKSQTATQFRIWAT